MVRRECGSSQLIHYSFYSLPAEECPKLFACQKPKFYSVIVGTVRCSTNLCNAYTKFLLSPFFKESQRRKRSQGRRYEFLRFRAECVVRFEVILLPKRPGCFSWLTFFNVLLIYDAVSHAKTVFCDSMRKSISVMKISALYIFILVMFHNASKQFLILYSYFLEEEIVRKCIYLMTNNIVN